MARISPLMILPPVIFAGIAAMFVIGMNREDPDALPSTLEGRQAPAVVVTPLADLPTFSDADLRDGKVKLVNFWASWCAPCVEEIPELQAALAEHADTGLAIIGIVYNDRSEAASEFMARMGGGWPSVMDPGGEVARDYAIYGPPESFFVDRDGVIRGRQIGQLSAADLERQLNTIL